MTCLTGKFQAPNDPTLDESLLRLPGKGAVAAWGATGLGVASGHKELADGFLPMVFSNTHTDLGTATLAGKLNVPAHNKDLVETYILFGDPAMKTVITNVTLDRFLYMPGLMAEIP
jgi:hypothetical protein